MSWLNERQGVLAQNVANADTPGYVAQDIKPLDFAKVLANATSPPQSSPDLATTDPHHIALSGNSAPAGLNPDDLEDTANNGEQVSSEEEMIKVADTQAQYQAAANLYSKAVDMMRTAIGTP
jgi:flagellar basal-body rod protein FlgB